MAQWKFQVLPGTRDLAGHGYRMGEVGQAFEDEVNEAMPYRFKFHGISKLVLILGQTDDKRPDYIEQLGVAQLKLPDFDLASYVTLDDAAKVTALRNSVLEAFRWFEREFEDTLFVSIARSKLPWAT